MVQPVIELVFLFDKLYLVSCIKFLMTLLRFYPIIMVGIFISINGQNSTGNFLEDFVASATAVTGLLPNNPKIIDKNKVLLPNLFRTLLLTSFNPNPNLKLKKRNIRGW